MLPAEEVAGTQCSPGAQPDSIPVLFLPISNAESQELLISQIDTAHSPNPRNTFDLKEGFIGRGPTGLKEESRSPMWEARPPLTPGLSSGK